jgi:hypothetical protein
MPALVEVTRTRTCTLQGWIPDAVSEVIEVEPAAVCVRECPQPRAATGLVQRNSHIVKQRAHTTWKVMSQISDTLKNSCFEIKGLRKQH